MAAIFIKEKLNYNWMIICSLTGVYFSVLSMLARGIRNLLFDNGIMVNLTFNDKFPMLKMLADSNLLHTVRGYFWLIGLIAMLVIYKIKVKKFVSIDAAETYPE